MIKQLARQHESIKGRMLKATCLSLMVLSPWVQAGCAFGTGGDLSCAFTCRRTEVFCDDNGILHADTTPGTLCLGGLGGFNFGTPFDQYKGAHILLNGCSLLETGIVNIKLDKRTAPAGVDSITIGCRYGSFKVDPVNQDWVCKK